MAIVYVSNFPKRRKARRVSLFFRPRQAETTVDDSLLDLRVSRPHVLYLRWVLGDRLSGRVSISLLSKGFFVLSRVAHNYAEIHLHLPMYMFIPLFMSREQYIKPFKMRLDVFQHMYELQVQSEAETASFASRFPCSTCATNPHSLARLYRQPRCSPTSFSAPVHIAYGLQSFSDSCLPPS